MDLALEPHGTSQGAQPLDPVRAGNANASCPESANDYAISLYSQLEPSRPISQSLTVAPMSWA